MSCTSYETRLPRHVASLARALHSRTMLLLVTHTDPAGHAGGLACCGLPRGSLPHPQRQALSCLQRQAAASQVAFHFFFFFSLLGTLQASAAPPPVCSHSALRLSLFAPTPPAQRGPAHTAHTSLERAQPTASPGQERTNAASARPLPHRKKQRRPR